MKPSLLSFFRKQTKMTRCIIFLLCWSQVHAISINNYIHNREKVNSLIKLDYSKDKEYLNNKNNLNSNHLVKERYQNDNQIKPNQIKVNQFLHSLNSINTLNQFYSSDLQEGVIGINKENPIDHVYDNVFIINIPDEIKSNKTYNLEYDVFGVNNHKSVTWFINDETSKENERVEIANSWTHQKERLGAQILNKGRNYVTFTIPTNANYFYKVKNVRITFEDAENKIVSSNKKVNFAEKLITKLEESILSYETASLKIEKNTLKEDRNFSISSLRDIDLPVLNSEMVNVTSQTSGYRFLPHGEHFSQPAKISIGYDKSKIPAGYTEQDIRTYYFDRDQKKWLALEKDSLMSIQNVLVSKTTHFTDMINGIIKVPESPETGNYSPNSIKDIKAANPTEGVVNIAPPTPNNMGTATTNFPLKIPAGRAGLQPSLSINYSSDGGNGWLGQGWDLSIPAISIDTRWGVPNFNPTYESEIYSIAGEQLTFKTLIDGQSRYLLPNREDGDKIQRQNEIQLYPRTENQFSKIIRHGTNTSNYWWEVFYKDGTRNIFGSDDLTNQNKNQYILKDSKGNIAYWALYRTIDANDNYIEYVYNTNDRIYYGTPGTGGQEIYIKEIYYTLNKKNPLPEFYKIVFNTDSNRDDVQINGKLGFLSITSKRLTNISIFSSTKFIRGYDFEYISKKESFFKSLLSSISEYYNDGQGAKKTFYTHKLDYYLANLWETDGGLYSPNAPAHDYSSTYLFNESLFNYGNFNSNYSILGGSKSKSKGTNYRFGVGAYKGLGFLKFNLNTIGVEGGESNANSETKTILIDIDGDGISDRVFYENGKVFYSKLDENNVLEKNSQRINTNFGAHYYYGKSEIPTLTNIGKSESSSWNIGFDAGFKKFSAGIDTSNSNNINKSYFMDFNNDGLIDFVINNKVYFNRIVNGLPTFLESNEGTPVPIKIKECIQPDNSPTPEELKELIELQKNNPLHDVVRVWTAPRDGNIIVKNNFNLFNYGVCPQDIDCAKLDGVAVSFQKSNELPLVKDILKNDFNNYSFPDQNFYITKGEKLYFRVTSKYNPFLDKVNWNPVITYTNSNLSVDENNRSLNTFSPSEDFFISKKGSYVVQKTGTYNLEIKYKNSKILSDDVKLILYKNGLQDPSVNITMSSGQLYDNTSNINIPLTFYGEDQQNDEVQLKVFVDSNINWPDLQIEAKLSLIENNQTVGIVDILNYENSYNNKIGNYETYIIKSDDVGKELTLISNITTGFSTSQGVTYNYSITAKADGKLLAKKVYSINPDGNSVLSNKNYIVNSSDVGKKVFLETSTSIYDESFKDFLLNKKYSLKPIVNTNNNLDYINAVGVKSIGLVSGHFVYDFNYNTYTSTTTGILNVDSNAIDLEVFVLEGNSNFSYSFSILDDYGMDYTFDATPSGMNSTKYSVPRGRYQYKFITTYVGSQNYQEMPADALSGSMSITESDNSLIKYTGSLGYVIKPYDVYNFSESPLSIYDVDTRLGSLYRGWGAFALNGNSSSNSNFGNTGSVNDMKIDVSKLYSIKPLNNLQIDGLEKDSPDNGDFNVDIDNIQYDAEGNPIVDSKLITSNHYFFPINEKTYYVKNDNNQSFEYLKKWYGVDEETFVDSNLLQSSRLGLKNFDLHMQYQNIPCSVDYTMGAPSFKTKNKSISAKGSVSISGPLGVGGSLAKAETKTLRSMLDFNGDGFPDDYNETSITLSNSRGYLSNVKIPNLGFASVGKTQNRGVSSGFSFSHGKSSRMSFIDTGAVAMDLLAKSDEMQGAANSVSVNVGIDNSKETNMQAYFDINGDGLPDRYDDEYFQLNVGNKLEAKQNWSSGYLSYSESISASAGLGFSVLHGSFSGGLNYSSSDDISKKELLDINSDGLPDIIDYQSDKIFVNTGNKFLYFDKISNQIRNAQSNNSGVNYGGNIAASIVVPLPVFIFGGIKLTFTYGKSLGTSVSRTKSSLRDMNGDGFVDYVISNDNNTASVYHYYPVDANRLKKVTLATGGSWSVEYDDVKSSYEAPGNKRVLKYLHIYDNFSDDNAFKPNVRAFEYEYYYPYYSRFERQFYGYGSVESKVGSYQNGNYGYKKTIQKYYNNNYYKKGLLYEVQSLSDDKLGYWIKESTYYSIKDRDNTNNSIQEKTTNVNIPNSFMGVRDEDKFIYIREEEKLRKNFSYFITPIKSEKIINENGKEKTTFSESLSFDNYGNITSFKDYGDKEIGTSEILNSTITYQNIYNGNTYLSIPTNVLTVGDSLKRERVAQYNSNGDLIKIEIKNNKTNTSAVYDFEYDQYGNLTKSTGPANANNERFYYEYIYDNKFATYLIQVKDAFGYSSKTTYDFNLGLPLYTEDMNLQPMKYKYDIFGRTTEITGPYEIFNNIPWTIRFTYPQSFVADTTKTLHYTLTEHYDPAILGNYIKTITFADGLGEAVQVKKTASIFDNVTKSETLKYIVSGKMVQDNYGRNIKTYYPTVEDINNSINFTYNSSVDSVSATEMTYDGLDRIKSTLLPNETVKSTISYDINSDYAGRKMLETTFTDELGKTKKTYADIKGRTTTVKETNSTGDIITSFKHDAVGNIVEVRDTKGNLTKSTYDDFGRRTKLEHPDSGVSTYEYDLAGNLISRTNANNQLVTYEYDFSRLKAVNYPDFPENNIKYFYGKAKDQAAMDNNAVGRLTYQTDATGTQMFKYGKLGELIYNRRSVAVPGAGVYWFDTSWEYDTWNRVKSIIYPDGEKVNYSYNQGGNLKSMASVKDGFAQNIIDNLGYDKFEQRVYLKYGNGTETTYNYEVDRRRLANMKAQTSAAKGSRLFMDNAYVYDKVSNVKSVKNNAAVLTGLLGGGSEMTYNYDDLYRLTSASGSWSGYNTSNQAEKQSYSVAMSYDELHNITEKKQTHNKSLDNGATWSAITPTSYRLTYSYDTTRPHAPKQIIDDPGTAATVGSYTDPNFKYDQYTYDAVGNPTEINKKISDTQNVKQKTFIWDEENRLRFVDTNPSTSAVDGAAIYTYDDKGERVIKDVLSTAYINGEMGEFILATKNSYTIYPSGLISAKIVYTDDGSILAKQSQNSKTQANNAPVLSYTKHYYAGSQRISSKLGLGANVGSFNCNWLIVPFGSGATELNEKSTAKAKLDANTAASLAIMQENSITPPVNYGQNAGYTENCVSSYAGNQEQDIYWYHPDHLGSSSFITGLDGEVTQSIDYFPSGEVFVENHKNSYNTPYKFNGKEQDSETGYYYYGARYYNPRVSLWLNVDPLADYNPFYNKEHYIDGQHNGGVYNSGNLNPYIYCYQKPVIFVDPNGKQGWAEGILGWIATDAAVPEPSDAAWPKWLAYVIAGGVAGTAIYLNNRPKEVVDIPEIKVKPIALPKVGDVVIPKTEKDKGDFASVRFQLQTGKENISSNTQINSKDVGVLKVQGYLALTLIYNDVVKNDPEMAKSPQFVGAIAKASNKIKNIVGGMGRGSYQTTIQELFIYNKKQYRIDIEVQRGVNFKR